ncbi:aquaporin-like protein [Panaeolus papilionaceus]|nr:aquaporin-like protein [Panaeolus papilionaceus]
MPSSDLESSYTPDTKVSSPQAVAELPVLDSYFPQQTKQTPWSRIRSVIREPMAEMIGVATFVIIGTGVDCSVVLSTNPNVVSSPRGDFLSVNFGWAIVCPGLALGAWISGGISGGHLNPAVTLALATWRGFPWRKVPQYLLAQVLGGLIGSALVYANYVQAIDIFEGGHDIRTRATASLFATYALDYLNTGTAFAVELFGACILTFMVLAMTDKKNNAIPHGLLPIGLFLVLLGLGVSLGMQTSYAFNPARDFGPRLMLTFAGYGKELYTYRSQYWLWAPILAPIIGAQVAAATYDIFLNEEDPFAPSSFAPITQKGKNVDLTPGSTCQV